MQFIITLFLFALLCWHPKVAYAEDVYEQPDAFVSRVFEGTPPEPKTLEIQKEWKRDINKMMDRTYRLDTTTYWEKDGRTVWILEEIGKSRPITTGYVVKEDEIESMKVLIYRESHGWEVKYDFFSDQFKGVQLKDSLKLDDYIDNISGATMSVDALTNLAELALYFHKHRHVK